MAIGEQLSSAPGPSIYHDGVELAYKANDAYDEAADAQAKVDVEKPKAQAVADYKQEQGEYVFNLFEETGKAGVALQEAAHERDVKEEEFKRLVGRAAILLNNPSELAANNALREEVEEHDQAA